MAKSGKERFRPNKPPGKLVVHDLFGLTPEERGWIVGFFEGEGCLSISKTKYPVLRINNTDLDVLKRFKELVGGKLYWNGIPKDNPNRKPIYSWSAYGWPSVANFFEATKDLLGNRRKAKFLEVMKLRPSHTYEVRPKSCGTDPTIPSSAGYKRHYKRGEAACADCCTALNLLQSETRRLRKLKVREQKRCQQPR